MIAWPSPPDRPAEFVLDATVAASWLPTNPYVEYAHAVMHRAVSTPSAVPLSWTADLATLMLAAERAGTATPARTRSFLDGLVDFPIVIDDETPYRVWRDALDVSRRHRLPLPRAAYLELAIRAALPLATTDPALTRAAARAGVPLVTP